MKIFVVVAAFLGLSGAHYQSSGYSTGYVTAPQTCQCPPPPPPPQCHCPAPPPPPPVCQGPNCNGNTAYVRPIYRPRPVIVQPVVVQPPRPVILFVL
ncbi:hypothetical protein L596_022784 [Steinernema carpocapsae]|uniref:VM domain-containing protein n=1 Tax=Steinernema carpocapsae TaxID=34508 RepID=A0A4U5MMS4_STECR|nr:hypothetical protein L596_022784 [Steinernema carpocapsae]